MDTSALEGIVVEATSVINSLATQSADILMVALGVTVMFVTFRLVRRALAAA